MGVREDPYHGRGATSESINALPSYKFKSKRRSRGETETNLDSPRSVGGLVAAGTDKERIISAEDAVRFSTHFYHLALNAVPCVYSKSLVVC